MANAKEKSDTISSSSNSEGTTRNKQSTKEPKKDLPIPVPFQVR